MRPNTSPNLFVRIGRQTIPNGQRPSHGDMGYMYFRWEQNVGMQAGVDYEVEYYDWNGANL